MARSKKEITTRVLVIDGNKVIDSEYDPNSELVQIVIPKSMSYVHLRKALEFAALRAR